MARACIIFNPVAGSGRGPEIADRAEARLAEAGYEVSSRATSHAGGARAIAAEIGEHTDLIVVVGGDGTLRETAEGLDEHRRDTLLAFVPIGNANVAARELGIPKEAGAALAVSTDGEPQAIDLGFVRADDGPRVLFLAMVGVGWDARTVQFIARIRATRLGSLWYRLWSDSVYGVCGLLAAFDTRTARLELRGGPGQRVSHVCGLHLCNFRSYGKGMAVAPDARPDSALLHYQARTRSGLPALLLHLLMAQLGRPAPRLISTYGSGTKLVAEAASPFPVQIDGDYLGEASRIEVEIEPAALHIMVPKSRLQIRA